MAASYRVDDGFFTGGEVLIASSGIAPRSSLLGKALIYQITARPSKQSIMKEGQTSLSGNGNSAILSNLTFSTGSGRCQGLRCRSARRLCHTLNSRHFVDAAPGLIAQEFNANQADEKWTVHITSRAQYEIAFTSR